MKMNSQSRTSRRSGRVRNKHPRERSSNKTYIWKCPSSGCSDYVIKTHEREDDAESLLRSHFENIIETTGKEYSLQSLIEKIEQEDGDVNPKQIWREYAKVSDSDDVSINCF